jgi:ABC-type nitrate/sulfonate/bicarbonate transport system substrate-binding protein
MSLLSRIGSGRAGLVLATTLAAAIGSGPAAAQNAVKFTLDWKFEGPAAPFLVPIDKGYYRPKGSTSPSTPPAVRSSRSTGSRPAHMTSASATSTR